MATSPVPEVVARFRAGLRPRAIGPRYQGWAHLAFTSFGSLAVIAFAARGVRAPSWLELLTVPASFLVANVAEYFGHKGPMHRKAPGLGIVFRRHTLEHHHFFTHQAMSFESTRDFKMVLFPPVLLIFFLGGIATPLGALAFWLLTPNCGWLFVATAMAYFLSYEWLHFSYHLPDEHWLSRSRVLARLRKHHTHHHDLALMGKWNFNITFPICDAVMGTSYQD
jgi:hypothetical protein